MSANLRDKLAGKSEADLDDTIEFNFLKETQDLELLLDIGDAEPKKRSPKNGV